MYYLGWCHGPVGTSRLYYSLFEATKDEAWLKKIKHTANSLMLEGIDKHETAGFWNNVGVCCGTAGVAEYFLWLYDISADKDYLEFSLDLTQNLITSLTHEDDHIKWIQAEHRSRPDYVAAQTGLMQGSAGIGLWFLQLMAHQTGRQAQITLPDKPETYTLRGDQ